MAHSQVCWMAGTSGWWWHLFLHMGSPCDEIGLLWMMARFVTNYPDSRGGGINSISQCEGRQEFVANTPSLECCYSKPCLFPLFFFSFFSSNHVICSLSSVNTEIHRELPLSLKCARTLAFLEGPLEARSMISTLSRDSANEGELSEDGPTCEIAWKLSGQVGPKDSPNLGSIQPESCICH